MQGSMDFTGTLSGQINDSGSGGTSNYNELTNKPSINSVPLVGNKTTEDLHLFSGDYDDLSDKPSVNGITLSGNKTTADLGLFSGNYNDLTNKPTLFSGDYNDLTNKPTLFSGDYNDLTNKPTLFDGDYDSLTDRPAINNVVLTGNKTTADLGLFSGNYNDLTNKPTLFDGDYDSLSSRPQINGNLLTGNKTTADLGLFSGNYNDLTNKPALFSGDYNDLTNKPTIPEIDMNPSGAVTEEMNDIEVDGTVYEVVDSAARGIIGDGQLDPGFTATNLTGAANELKSNLTDLNASLTQKTTWVNVINETIGTGSQYDQTLTMTNMPNYTPNEIMFCLMRTSNNRIFASAIVPWGAWQGSAVYACGEFTLYSGQMNTAQIYHVNAVCIQKPNNQCEIAVESLVESIKVRVYVR